LFAPTLFIKLITIGPITALALWQHCITVLGHWNFDILDVGLFQFFESFLIYVFLVAAGVTRKVPQNRKSVCSGDSSI